MTRPTHRRLLALIGLLAVEPAFAEDTIKNYLFAHNAGPVAANDIIGVSKSVISDLQTPRALALSLGSFGDRHSQNGFGISLTPGRSSFDAIAVVADKYRDGDLMRRIWGGTTFSFAQNRKKIGSGEYDQSAYALSATFLLDKDEDPIVVAYRTLARTEGEKLPCHQEGLEEASWKFEQDARRRVAAFEVTNKRLPNLAELTQIQKEVDAASDKEEIKAMAVLRNCAFKVAGEVESKWNASRFQVLFGRGWIKPASGAGSRQRLATHAKLSLALRTGADGLLNLTWRRANDELDLATLGGMPSYKSTHSAALRYTHKASKKGDLFAIAEVSNVKAHASTVSQTDFKQALGFDKMVAPGLWFELRYGRAQSTTGSGMENKVLFTFKFSEDASLGKQVK